ncbi:hypothetical protein GCM10023093_03370 [Nemorincola caseinilytica]|uniref:histidine kinase n=1 Tax=Nemorincola caseinilytica TaxID=2054315 RepID=A0ABP8N386_9BACT
MELDRSVIIFIMGSVLFIALAFALIVFLVIHKKKRYEHLLEKQTMENNYHNQLLLSRMEVQEQSFRYFSEEIHDNIGQLLSIVKMQLHNIRRSSNETEIVARAKDCTELLGKAISDLRNISHTLNSVFVTNVGLPEAVEKDLEYIRSAKDVKCTLHNTGEDYSIGEERELLVFRIIQEAIANAVKHASPSAIDVYLDHKPHMLVVRVVDNGMGFEAGSITKSGIGLSNMQMRAALLKGRLDVASAKGGGTTISLQIDRESAAA